MAAVEGTDQRILIAEDNADQAELFQRILTVQGHEVQVVTDGLEALERITEDPPDLILLDLDMPRMNGFEVCRRVKQHPATRLIPIIIITGEDDFEAKLRAWDLGADDFLSKPLQVVELVARCRSLLRVKRLIDALDTAEAVVFALARVVDAKNSYTHQHSERVSRYALALADEVGLIPEQAEILHKGALLHDIGKIGIPDTILNKSGPLTAEEYAEVKKHPIQGAMIVESLRTLRDVLPLIRSHHERLDGRGYPDGLAGEDIPLLARILSVADVYDALASARPYRSAISAGTCLEMLQSSAAGGGLDHDLVDIFCGLKIEESLTAEFPKCPFQGDDGLALVGNGRLPF